MADPAAWAAGAAFNAEELAMAAQVKSLIRAAHREGQVVIVGRGGQVVLAGLPDVLHVRVMAPPELRIRRHQERAGVTEAAAREQVLKRDEASADFVRHYYDADLADPALYDLIINTAKVTPSVAADLIIKAMECLPTKATPG